MKCISKYKNSRNQYLFKYLLFVLPFLILSFTKIIAQETDTIKSIKVSDTIKSVKDSDTTKKVKPKKLARSTFESVWLIDNPSVMVARKGTFEFDIQHRFGTLDNGYNDFFGMFASSNIRLGFNYSPIDRLSVGFGITKSYFTWDMNVKYAILRQTRSGGSMPISLTYYGNIAIDSRSNVDFTYGTDRLSFFHQLIIARKISPKFSVQVAPSLSHYNAVEAFINEDGEKEGLMNNDHFAIAIGGRYKVSDAMAVIANYDQPITKHKTNNPNPNISFGIEIATSNHAFQVFAGNYYDIIPQRNNVFNNNNYADGTFLIGFNITRLWNF
jgi:uncharacterized beta barrel domain-containing protein DUF5777